MAKAYLRIQTQIAKGRPRTLSLAPVVDKDVALCRPELLQLPQHDHDIDVIIAVDAETEHMLKLRCHDTGIRTCAVVAAASSGDFDAWRFVLDEHGNQIAIVSFEPYG